MSLFLTSSNRFEHLLDKLLASMGQSSASPFVPDTIIVPSVGMRRRIELALAERHGICANVQFPFLAQWLWEQIAKVVPGVDEASPFAPARLCWRIFRILGNAEFTQQHPPLARYLAGGDERMRYDLANRVASLFDQYITYRDDWLDTWTRRRAVAPAPPPAAFRHEPWQADLWRRIADELGATRQHPSVAFFRALDERRIDASAAGLPAVAHVFCLPSIAPLYVRILRELARWADVHVYVLNPCEAYWLEIVAPRRLAQVKARRQDDYHEVGNRLLAQWGGQTKAHLQVMLETWEQGVLEASAYEPIEAHTLLGAVQRSMLELTELAPGSLASLRTDRTIEIHACHSLTRQLEVLQDQLLAMFAEDPTLRASDVLVVTPHLQDAVPLIEAVFGNVAEERRIPFDITGRAHSTHNPVARAVLDVLQLATSRFHASAVYELLQQPIVARKFDLDEHALDSIHAWVRDAGIRWGLSAEHRAMFDVPALARHSFADGLDRLFLGYALPDGAQEAMGDSLPAGHVEGSDAAALGSFWRVVRLLDSVREDLARSQTASEWLRVLQRISQAFLAPDDEELEDQRELDIALLVLHEDIRAAAETLPLGIDVMRAAITAVLDDPARGGVPGGAVTFASMSSLRNLPYRVVCAIGLDDNAFPALDRPLEFDLIAAAPRPGDRQRRAEDRNVFLDLLLAARQRLYLSYTGRNIRDNAPLPPSAVIADLLEVLVPALAEDPRSSAALAEAHAQLVVDHPLQPFSAQYFRDTGDPRIRSFHQEYCQALKRRIEQATTVRLTTLRAMGDESEEVAQDPAAPFFAAALPKPDAEWRVLTVERLLQFFRNPCRYLLRQRLGISLPDALEELDDDEPFLPDYRAPQELAERVLPVLLGKDDHTSASALAHAGIEYPPGGYGAHLLEQELASLEAFATRVRALTASPALDPISRELAFDIDGERWTLQGVFGDLRPEGLVRHRYDDVRPTDYLAGWIPHLFLNAIDAPVAKETVWQSRDGAYRLASVPVPEARARLEELLRLYARGLSAPLHFFPKAAWAYAVQGTIDAAVHKWLTRPAHPFEREDQDPAYRLALRGVEDPLDQAFEDCARTVFGPLLDAITDPRIER